MYQNVDTRSTHKCHRWGIKLNIHIPRIPQNKKKKEKKELLHEVVEKNSY